MLFFDHCCYHRRRLRWDLFQLRRIRRRTTMSREGRLERKNRVVRKRGDKKEDGAYRRFENPRGRIDLGLDQDRVDRVHDIQDTISGLKIRRYGRRGRGGTT